MGINANDLRRLAETADGMRGVDVALIVRNKVPMVVTAGGEQPGDTVCFSMRTTDLNPAAERPDVVHVHLPIENKTIDLPSESPDDSKKYDALFWSESAIFKFVMPYYSHEMTPAEYTAMAKNLTDPSVVAAAHNPKSDTLALGAGGSLDVTFKLDGALLTLPYPTFVGKKSLPTVL